MTEHNAPQPSEPKPMNWTNVDRLVRERASEALRSAGYEREADELDDAGPIFHGLAALDVTHRALQLRTDDTKRSERARELLERVAFVGYAAYAGHADLLPRYLREAEALADALAAEGATA